MSICKDTYWHQTVLLEEAVDALCLQGVRADGIYVDGTYGRGGHSEAILRRLSPIGQLIAFDKDPQAIAHARSISDIRFKVVHASFVKLPQILEQFGVKRIDGILMDLGISSPQVDDARRGFSFKNDGPLDMRMDTTQGISASEWIAQESEARIAEVIGQYGEERFARQIAKAIVVARQRRAITSTAQLASIVAGAVRSREKGKDPATRSFQAIRIHINRELTELEKGLEHAYRGLGEHGRMVVISFHSLEDRMVKHFLIGKANQGTPNRRLPIRACELAAPALRVHSKVKPSEAEVDRNPRARSAVMRVGERLLQAEPRAQ